MYIVKDNNGRETRCDTWAEALYVEACWYKCGSETVEIVILCGETS